MYIPDINSMSDKIEVVDFMQRFSFATIITAKDGLPVATHLPFIVMMHENTIVLRSHFAKANEQWRDIAEHKVLVIFSEPHAYISPKHYEKELNVPTWNYISVHAYGKGTLIMETDKVIALLEQTIDNYDAAYKEQWNRLPNDYKTGMSNGIVAFDIIVTDLQAKKKLSQNKTPNEQLNIINGLSISADSNERLIADYMKQHQNV